MDPINPWLDADEVRQLAESLMPARTVAAASINDAGFNDSFVGFAGPDPVAVTAPVAAPTPISIPVPVATPAPAAVITPVPVTTPAPVAAPTPAAFSSASSFQTFQARIQQSHRAESLFVIDHTSKAVFGEDHYPQFHFIARSLSENGGRRTFPKGHIHIKIGPAKTLEIIPLHLPNRAWVAGVIVPNPLPAETISQWVGELTQCV